MSKIDMEVAFCPTACCISFTFSNGPNHKQPFSKEEVVKMLETAVDVVKSQGLPSGRLQKTPTGEVIQ